jgi:hypothetical protein
MGSPHDGSLFLFSDIFGQLSVASLEQRVRGRSERECRQRNYHQAVVQRYIVDSPLGRDTSLRIDAMMNYEFEWTNSESFHRVSPDERHIPFYSHSTSMTRRFFYDDLRTLLLRV